MSSEWKARLGLVGLTTALTAMGLSRMASFGAPVRPIQTRAPEDITSQPAAANRDSELQEEAGQILEQMSRITGLPIKSQVRYRVVNHAQVEQYIIHNLRSQYTPAQFHIQEAMLMAFGLVPPDFNLRKFLIAFYTEQAAGFYDPKTKTMYIARWLPQAMQSMVLAHELTHALQDQNFGLEEFLNAARRNDDASAARQAFVEGYATAAMVQQMIEPARLGNFFSIRALLGPVLAGQIAQFPVFSKAPFFLRYESLFPYAQGAAFAQDALRQGGWKQLNAVFNDAPESTKDFFDPQIYFQHVQLPKLALPQPKSLEHAKNMVFLEENTLGELGIYTLVGQLISQEEARKISPGWLADRYLLYQNRRTEGYAVVGSTLWSEPAFAQEFFHDEVTILRKKYPTLRTRGGSTDGRFLGRTSKGDVMVLLEGSAVEWAEGVPADRARAVLQVLRSLKNGSAVAGAVRREITSAGLSARTH
jgi:hypothetical protein